MNTVKCILNEEQWRSFRAAIDHAKFDSRPERELLLSKLFIVSGGCSYLHGTDYFTFVERALLEFQDTPIADGAGINARRTALLLCCEWACGRLAPDDAHRNSLEQIAKYLTEEPFVPSTPVYNDLPLIDVVTNRTTLFQPFLKYAIERDVVFALGGVGSGLETFLSQFHDYLKASKAKAYNAVDFNFEHYDAIRMVRNPHAAQEPNYGVHLPLKCLLAALAYEAFSMLNKTFPDGVERVMNCKGWLASPASFADWYFGLTPAMRRADPSPVIRLFFEKLQELAKEVAKEGVIVFMPLESLASCFGSAEEQRAPTSNWGVAKELWDALGELSGTPGEFDKVCLIVAAQQFPYAHSLYNHRVVGRSVWCIPPLSVNEIEDLLAQAYPALPGSAVSQALLQATGGVPWLVRVILSCPPLITLRGKIPVLGAPEAEALVAKSIQFAENAIDKRGRETKGELGKYISEKLKVMSEILGAKTDDPGITLKWKERDQKRRVYTIKTPRVEEFVASGIIWLDGDPWKLGSEDSVFADYPNLRFRAPCRLTIAVHNCLTDNRSS